KNTVPSDGGYGVYKVYSDCVYFMVKFGFNDLTALSRRTGAVRILNRKEASPF
ncbi:LOW QUALITY PROTEIN: conserved hypothetical protein, partial [Neisseria gonorrhoeae 1291]